MTVFKDPINLGVAWLVYSSEDNMVMHVAALTPDFRATNGTMERILINSQREAPAVFSDGRAYYMITSGCTGWAPNAAEVFVASHMLGPWHSLGDPTRGANAAVRSTTFHSQPSFVIPLQDLTRPDPALEGRFILMADRWNSHNLGASRYVWLPMVIREADSDSALLKRTHEDEHKLWHTVVVRWHERWSIGAELLQEPR